MASTVLIEKLYKEIEMEMLTNVARILGNGEGITQDNVVNWQVERLSHIGELTNKQLEVLRKYSGLTMSELEAFIEENGLEQVERFDRIHTELSDLTYIEPTNLVKERIKAVGMQAKSSLDLTNSTMLDKSNELYQDILNKAVADTITGSLTPYQSMVRSINAAGSKGLTGFVAKNGAEWSAEAYVSMVIRATRKNTVAAVQEARFDEYEIDLVEISSHAGSRPSHMDYQGKIYSRSGTSKRFPPLDSTSYGAIDGIVTGINCGHQMYAYILGASKKRYEPYKKRESEEVYAQSQQQRKLERNIRSAKKEKQMLEAMNAKPEDIAKANQKIRDRQANMRDFIDDTGRTRRRTAEQIV
ncbi:MAG: hypothetical protein JJU16_05225 [Alkalibacterium sp.]|nr:hypothetical protein [Alkalibacterium sp.]